MSMVLLLDEQILQIKLLGTLKMQKQEQIFFCCMKNNQSVHVKFLKTSKEIWDQIKTNF
jgi:hypothetical protein